MNNDLQILPLDTIIAQERAFIDVAVHTAKHYPRKKINDFLLDVETYAGMDEETAEDCFYALKRGKGDDSKIIEGLSIRFAEIIANCWGNLRIKSSIVGIGDKMVTVEVVCHDLESNLAFSIQVLRRITDKYGNRFSDDLIIMTANACSSIAYRNAVLRIVPKSITKSVVEKIRQISLGKAMDVEKSRSNAIQYFKKLGISEKELFDHLEIKGVADMDREILLYLNGLKTALKEGTATLDDTFRPKNETTLEKKGVFAKKEEVQPQEQPTTEKKESPAHPSEEKKEAKAEIKVEPKKEESATQPQAQKPITEQKPQPKPAEKPLPEEKGKNPQEKGKGANSELF